MSQGSWSCGVHKYGSAFVSMTCWIQSTQREIARFLGRHTYQTLEVILATISRLALSEYAGS